MTSAYSPRLLATFGKIRRELLSARARWQELGGTANLARVEAQLSSPPYNLPEVVALAEGSQDGVFGARSVPSVIDRVRGTA